MTPRTVYRVVAIAEAITWTMLIGGLIIRAIEPDLRIAVTIGGGTHGFVFLAYAATALFVALHQRWNLGIAFVAVGAAVIPYATIPVHLWLHRSGRLEGAWRTQPGDDPRDHRPIDRLVSWVLRHPIPLVALAAVAVIAVFVILLLNGPPGS